MSYTLPQFSTGIFFPIAAMQVASIPLAFQPATVNDHQSQKSPLIVTVMPDRVPRHAIIQLH